MLWINSVASEHQKLGSSPYVQLRLLLDVTYSQEHAYLIVALCKALYDLKANTTDVGQIKIK